MFPLTLALSTIIKQQELAGRMPSASTKMPLGPPNPGTVRVDGVQVCQSQIVANEIKLSLSGAKTKLRTIQCPEDVDRYAHDHKKHKPLWYGFVRSRTRLVNKDV